MKKILVGAALLFVSSHASAKVFQLNNQSAGTYIQGTAGNSVLADSAYSRSTVSFENKVSYNASGEFGLMFRTSRTWIRAGVEVLRPHVVDGAQGKNAAGDTLYRVNSGIIAWGPVLNFEFPLKIFDSARLFLGGGVGYMSVTVKNDYQMTALGNTTYGVADYAEEATGYTFMSQAALGFEMSLADSATFVLSTGYRGLTAYGLKHERSNATIDGNINAGDAFRDNNGDRVINLSGFWAGVGLRFYWNY